MIINRGFSLKYCKKCCTEKSKSLFCVDKSKHDGLSYACKECISKYKATYDDKLREKLGKQKRVKKSSSESKAIRVIRKREYRHSRIDDYRAFVRAYKRNNSAKIQALNAKRRADLVSATPVWANLFFIEEAYRLCKLRSEITGVKHHVDHIVPLKSDLVCGLHVENNLQVIPAVINLKKSNRFDGDVLGTPN